MSTRPRLRLKILALLLLSTSLASAQSIQWGVSPSSPSTSSILRMHYAGAWLVGTAYNEQDVVSYSGSTYISMVGSNTGHLPSTLGFFWQSLGGPGGVGAGVWGSITGTISNQLDLGTALGLKEPSISAGTSSQYWRGDKSWQTLSTAVLAAMSGLYQSPISGAPGTWPSFGAVATSNSYNDLSYKPTIPSNTSQISESGLNVYFTDGRAQSAMAGLYVAPIASGTQALGSIGSIASGTCSSALSTTASGVLTTDVIAASFAADPTGVVGFVPGTSGMLSIIGYPTSGHVVFRVCNNTAIDQTPGAISINWHVVR